MSDTHKELGKLVADNYTDIIAAICHDAEIGHKQGFTVRPAKLMELVSRIQSLYNEIRQKELN